MKYQAQIDDTTYELDIDGDGIISIAGEQIKAELLQVGPLGLYSLLIDHRSIELVVEEISRGFRVTLGSRTFDVLVVDERQLRLARRA